MDRDSTLINTGIDMEDTEEQEGISLVGQHQSYSKEILGISVEEQKRNQDRMDSTHEGMNRDPKRINDFLKVTFEDVIAEPESVHSFDKVWLWSHALFEVSRLYLYHFITLMLAVPVALLAGLLFSILSFLHIWLVVPSMQLLLINMHWVKVVWASVLDLTITPLFSSMGRSCESFSIRWTKA